MKRVLSTTLLVVVFGCGPGPRWAYEPADLRAAVAERPGTAPDVPIVVPFDVGPQLLARAREITRRSRSDHDRANKLLKAITDPEGFGLVYEPVTTTVAPRTVEAGQGNCLSLTSVYVGLARGIGLSAYYIDASDRINDIRREERLIVDSGHIAAVVRTERGYSMVDFDAELSEYRTFRIIDDIEALAHFYNNRGYEILHAALDAGDEVAWNEVRQNFEMATRILPKFARAHNNLGVVYSRLGFVDVAARHYGAAIQADAKFAAPHHNLGNLSLREGKYDEALAAYARAIELQGDNPFLHYHHGLALYSKGLLEESVGSFNRAIRLKQDYLEPRNVLAQVYRLLGRDEDAERVLRSIPKKKEGATL